MQFIRRRVAGRECGILSHGHPDRFAFTPCGNHGKSNNKRIARVKARRSTVHRPDGLGSPVSSCKSWDAEGDPVSASSRFLHVYQK